MSSSLASSCRNLRDLEPWERRWLFIAMLVLPLTAACLRLLGIKRMLQLCQPELRAARIPAELDPLAYAHRCARLTDIAGNHGPFRATCLPQTLALCWLLRRRGVNAVPRIGINRPPAGFGAHAWAELDNVPLGQTVETYQPLPSLADRQGAGPGPRQ